jgi:SHS2 domain-containing protein
VNNFWEIEHTADLGIEVKADSIISLFKTAIEGYYQLVLSEPYSIGKTSKFNYSNNDSSLEDLLIDILGEINYLLMVKKEVVNSENTLTVTKKNSNNLIIINGYSNSLNNPEDVIKTEIKAVTYHQVKIENKNGIYSTRIFFDI